jgi:antitoxin (DNA-binding transcriptional repressor) of toxin-antitoxin stability system
MKTIDINDVQDMRVVLSKIVSGETITIVDANKPVAELKSLAQNGTQNRPYGLCAGEFVVPEDFDKPLPDEMLCEFEHV